MMWIHSKELQQNKKISKVDLLPDGWVKGRIVNWNKLKQKESVIKEKSVEKLQAMDNNLAKIKIKQIKKTQHRENEVNKYRDWYHLYADVGYVEFVKLTGYQYSQPNLVQRFASLLHEFVPQNGKKRK